MFPPASWIREAAFYPFSSLSILGGHDILTSGLVVWQSHHQFLVGSADKNYVGHFDDSKFDERNQRDCTYTTDTDHYPAVLNNVLILSLLIHYRSKDNGDNEQGHSST